jgi:hypothetical protein
LAVATSGTVRALIALSLDVTMLEVALGVLADLAAVSTAARREMAEDETAHRALVEENVARHVSAWCQVHAMYLVMALAHGGGHAERELVQWMRWIGAMQALLEVSLLGSPLARSRATKTFSGSKTTGRRR